jgi:deazaflavin-dependent oxidoreductase (nitroreductase family)
VKLPSAVVRVANALTNLAIIAGIPRPPYHRGNALVVETIGRRSGKRRRVPLGYLDDGGRIIVVVEDGSRADWVRNSLADGGRLRIHFRGAWRSARLHVLEVIAGELPQANEPSPRCICSQRGQHARCCRAPARLRAPSGAPSNQPLQLRRSAVSRERHAAGFRLERDGPFPSPRRPGDSRCHRLSRPRPTTGRPRPRRAAGPRRPASGRKTGRVCYRPRR